MKSSPAGLWLKVAQKLRFFYKIQEKYLIFYSKPIGCLDIYKNGNNTIKTIQLL